MLYKCKQVLSGRLLFTFLFLFIFTATVVFSSGLEVSVKRMVNGRVSGGLVAFSHWWAGNHYTVGWVTLSQYQKVDLVVSYGHQVSSKLREGYGCIGSEMACLGSPGANESSTTRLFLSLCVDLPIHNLTPSILSGHEIFSGHPNDLEGFFCLSIFY